MLGDVFFVTLRDLEWVHLQAESVTLFLILTDLLLGAACREDRAASLASC